MQQYIPPHAIHSHRAIQRMLKHTKWTRWFSTTRSRKLFFVKTVKIFQKTKAKYPDCCCKRLDSTELDLFHTAIWPILMVAQCFAIMPLINIVGPHPYRVQFKYDSWGFVATGAFLFFGSGIFLFFSVDIISTGINSKNLVGMVFFCCGLCACTLFARLARRWPELIKYWTRVEIIFLALPYEPTKWTLKYKIRLSACIIAALFAVEHGMFFASNVYGYKMQKLSCNITQPPAGYEDFMKQHFKFIFAYIHYNILVTFPLLFLNATFTFIWNYMDLFIVLISLGLATRFQQIGVRAERLLGRNIPQCTWYEIRRHYMQLCELLENVDEQLSSIVLLSSVNNLYFICCQILSVFNKLRWPINYVYFWYSLLYLIGRTVFVFLCASKIHDESKVPLRALRSVERFSAHITEECVALSGRKLFFITRKLVFGMAATVVTYELVLLQFEELNKGEDLPPLCG